MFQARNLLAIEDDLNEFFQDISGLLSGKVFLQSPHHSMIYTQLTFYTSLGQLVVLNAPSSFGYIWRMMKPWLAKETVDKVQILGGDYKQVLLDFVDAENLPSIYGGSCYCGEEGPNRTGQNCSLRDQGSWMDGRVGWGPSAKKLSAEQEVKDERVKDEPKEVPSSV